MAAVTSQSLSSAALTTPAVITAASSDTIAEGQFGANGCIVRVISTGTLTNVSISDPGVTPQGNPGTVPSLATPATGNRMLFIPRSAINPTTGNATINFSSITGITYELYRV
jgi:hypothetical protein